MATPVLIPVLEYLNTSYRPDCDYIDGEVKERNLGERPHSQLQDILLGIFRDNRRTRRLLALPEQRVQVSPTRFRIPDISLVRPADLGNIVREPPLLCIEILSREDTLRSTQERIDDYLRMGVEHIWVIDPVKHLAWSVAEAGLEPVLQVLTVPGSDSSGTEVRIDLEPMFAELEDLLAGRL